MSHKNNLFVKKINIIIILFISIIFFIYGYEGKENYTPKAVNGKIDLSNWSFEKDGLVKLDGQWQFYCGELLEPIDFKDRYQNETVDYFIVPNLLKTTINNHKIPKFGYGTMRLIIKMPFSNERIYGIKNSIYTFCIKNMD